VAKTLFSDQSLRPCPRCQHPARCHSVKSEGVCSRGDCGFQFCILCLCAFHGSKECGSQSAGRRKKDKLLPGSFSLILNVSKLGCSTAHLACQQVLENSTVPVFGSNEEPVPVEQQSQLSECGAALKDGTDYLPLLDRGEAASSFLDIPVCSGCPKCLPSGGTLDRDVSVTIWKKNGADAAVSLSRLWVNAIYFWRDLQNYHKLFSQDGQDPYRVQREAQLLYSTYIFNSARRSINVNAEVRMEVYNRMLPAFEELFNGVEEHALDILLEPWTLLIKRDKESFQQVCVQEEVRCIDSPEYRELQRLYKESDQQLRQRKSMFFPSPIAPSPYFSKGSQLLDAWSRVSPIYQGYRLGSILRQHHEIGHFMAFLQKHKASIHLMCWLDLEQYRRTSKRDKTIRQEWSSQIALKYLNNKYLFGPDSPATTEQQNDILRSAGGQEALKIESLSIPVVMEIQEIIRNHIEETWLPLFLSTTEFSERQKNKEKRQTAERFSQHIYYRGRARKGAWKPDRLWMSCSKEILLFRRTLLDPSTCQQFQHFVSLKGDFLENDVRFWVEVQRYK
ncbi:hypothetical protein XENORESO_021787, partial [Xenotaenia resolanae]